MLFNAVLIGTGLVVITTLRYMWRHRNSRLTRGVADAAVTYNVLHGQAPPPTIPRSSAVQGISED